MNQPLSSDDGFLRFLVESVRKTVGHDALTDAKADALKMHIMHRYGGDTPYICKIDPDRRANVLRDFNGRNRDAVCDKYQISRAQFYRFLKGR